MAAPVLRQSTALGTALHVLGGTVTLPAWGTATLNASRIVVFLGINNFQIDGIDATASVGTVAMTLGTAVTRQSTGHDAVSTRVFRLTNSAGTVAAPKIVTSGSGTVNLWYSAHEVTGDDPSVAYNVLTTGVGSGSVITLGPSATTTVSDVLWLGAVTIPNVQPLSLSGGSFTQVLAGASGSAYDQSEATGLVAKLPATAIGSATMVSTVSANRQYAGLLYAIPATAGTAFGGGGGAPRQFPLGPPDMTGATVLTDADPTVRWNQRLDNATDYILNFPAQRSKPISVIGGRNVYIPYLNIKIVGSNLGEMVAIGGGAAGRITHLENFHLDPNGYEIDAFKTQTGGSGRIIQLKTGRVETLVGQQTTVHADVFQASGGVSELWVEDLTAHTAYAGLQLQQEGRLVGTVSVGVATASRSGTVATITTSSAHGLTAGKYVSIENINPDGYNGGFLVNSAPSGTVFTVVLGANSPGSYVGGGDVQEQTFNYTVGDFHANRVNIKGFSRGTAFDPASALQCIRVGARTAPTSGVGTGGGRPNEDQTPLTAGAWAGTVSLGTAFYAEPATGTLASFVEPDTGTANWATVRSTYNGTASPHYATWASWPAVGGTVLLGPPPQGDFVIVSGNTVIATQAGTPTLPAPVNTALPALTPVDPISGGTVTTTLGIWSNADAATKYTVNILSSLGGTASYGTAQTSTNTSSAVTTSYVVAATDVGYALKPQVIADNGSGLGTALGSATNLAADDTSVTIDIVVE